MADVQKSIDEYRASFDDSAASWIDVAVSKFQGARKFAVAFLNTAVSPIVATVLGADSKTAAAVAGVAALISGGVYKARNRTR